MKRENGKHFAYLIIYLPFFTKDGILHIASETQKYRLSKIAYYQTL